MLNQISTTTVQKMSSIEIANLTGKQHKNVLTDIRKMLFELELRTADFSAVYKNQQHKDMPCFNLPERETMILVSGYSIKMRAAIIDRWQELEQQVKVIKIFPYHVQRYLERKETVPIRHTLSLFFLMLLL